RRRSSAPGRPCWWTGRARTPRSPSRVAPPARRPRSTAWCCSATGVSRRGASPMSTSSRWTATSSSPNRPLGVLDRLAFVVASVFGAGYSPVASGTVGSLVTAVAIWLLPLPPFRIAVTPLRIAVALVVVILLGIWAGSRVERVLGRKDPGVIVIDEVAGMLLSVVLLPLSIPVLVTAFLLFRLFDIWKPVPARESQALTGGMGVMVDDLIAGLYTLVLVMGARALFGVPA